MAGERLRTALAASAYALLLFGYYILRPVRDQIAVQTGTGHVPWLFTWTFLSMLALVPLFGWVVKRCPQGILVPIVYGTMSLCLLGFIIAFSIGVTTVSATIYFVWVSVFNMMIVSLFWSTVSDTFTTEQAKRRYGQIAAGGTIGAISGPAITAVLAKRVPTPGLLALSMSLLIAAAVVLIALRRRGVTHGAALRRPIGGSVFAGVTQTAASPMLMGLAGLVMCYSTISTVLYLQLTDIAGQAYTDAGDRTAFFARIDLGVNLLSLTIQLLATQMIVRRWGLTRALLVAPTAMLAGLTFVGLWPTAVLYGVAQVLQRAGEFSLSKPSREILFTVVNAESRYKAKNFIDTVIYRGNDASSAWVIESLRAAHLNVIWWVALPVILIWITLCRLVGRRYDTEQSVQENPAPAGAVSTL